MSDHVKRRAMPIRSSIHWKPLRDSHYVVASLEPGQGGRRQLFIKQTTLVEVQTLVRRASAQPALGLLLGRRWECPITGTSYLTIEALIDDGVAPDESSLETAMGALVARFRGRDGLERVGWYVGAASLEQRALARTHAAVHTAWFPEPWQSTLVVGDGGAAGAFYLHDTMAMRWFQSPFYEELEPSKKGLATKTTSISWPNYLTTDSIAPLPARPPIEAKPSAPVPLPRPARARRMPSVTVATTGRTDRAASRVAGPSLGRLAARAIGSALGLLRGAVLSASKSSWTLLHHASSRLVLAIAQRGPAVRASLATVGKSMASSASSMARASLGSLARARAASSRLLEEGAARRQAALARAAAAAQRAEAARAAASRRQAEAAQAETDRREKEAARAAAAREAARVSAAHREAEAAQAARRQAEALAREQAELARRNAAAARPPVDVPVDVPAIAEPTARSRSTPAARRASNGTVPPPSAPVPAAMAPAVDLEDTAASDPPFRYLALASRDGFALITNSQTSDKSDFWLLEDADSGMLLTVVTSDLGVREAVLHYNLHTDDDGLLQHTPSEHRDLESRTIYVRESVVEGLRTRVGRLRATGALVREWKITPPIDLPRVAGSGTGDGLS